MFRFNFWLRSWFYRKEAKDLNHWMQRLDANLAKLAKDKQKSDRELETARDAVRRAQEQVDLTVKRNMQAILRAEGLNKQLDEQLSAANEALKTANLVVIPGLVAANQVFTARWEAESAVFAMRQMASRKDVE